MPLSSRFALIAAAPLLAFAALFASSPGQADAHPLGNFTVNRYARIELFSDAVRVKYIIDMAEIPAFQEIESIDRDGDGTPSEAETPVYLASKTPDLLDGITLTLGDEERDLEPVAQQVTYPEGQAGLSTVRIELLLQTPSAPGPAELTFADDNFSDRVGWKEIVIAPAEGVVLSGSSAPTQDTSRELTEYPGDLLSSPLDVRTAHLTFDATDAAPSPPVSSLSSELPETTVRRAGDGFASLIDARNLTVTVIVLSILAAFAFGALHALEPGHGKTLVAAYFVGVKATAKEAVLLGLIIAATHTIGVFTIGLIILFGSQFILPETLYPWLSLASGLMVLALGLRLLMVRSRGLSFLRRIVCPNPFIRSTSSTTRHHDHAHGHDHAHPHAHQPPAGSPWKGLVAIGLADGLTPSPSALIVLLAAVSLDRIGLGVLLIVAFSAGLAAVLTLVCLAFVYARRLLDWATRRGHGIAAHPAFAWAAGNSAREGVFVTAVPVAGAFALTAVGLLLTLRALPGPNLPF
jgi:ABC-type nickel/cobalt efflux system permease component RcnA